MPLPSPAAGQDNSREGAMGEGISMAMTMRIRLPAPAGRIAMAG